MPGNSLNVFTQFIAMLHVRTESAELCSLFITLRTSKWDINFVVTR